MDTSINAINTFLNDSQYFYTIAVDLNSVYSYVSPNYDRNFSFGRGTLLGQSFSVTLHPEDIEVCAAAGYRCLQHPEELVPVTLRKHDGQGGFVTTRWEMQATLGPDGSPSGVYCIGTNISELVITKDKLGHAETQLEEIGFIQSHVVRKPLANILGLATLLQTTEPNPELLDLLFTSAKELDQVVIEISEKTN
ncbi:PAS domain-containing protein [Daejeonella lutea]|uniref:PAS fold-containing protein n=1 Tax=Daejeonella lutea TaxID=572036 RepID=A0A1T5ENI8_9SPHI|nr:PAS domain-containing protein [Daejeonella lutea]SKB85543.1 hypothetical protein SAMN05661099_3085 [Daejeonella lutea]